MMKSILLIAFMLTTTYTLTIGNCEVYSLDGENCEKCVDYHHLYDGQCFIDILGCKEYVEGNICGQCQNHYMMVNNLCCDHNCLGKIFKRYKSETVKKVVSEHSDILKMVIPMITEKVLKGKMNNLIEIEAQEYHDVYRYVFLFQFYMVARERKRVIVDYTKQQGSIIFIDESQVIDGQNYLDFHAQEFPLEIVDNLKPILSLVYVTEPNISKIKKIGFTNIQQYEVVTRHPESQSLKFKTFYFWNNRPILLMERETVLEEFQPSEISLESSEVEKYYGQSEEFRIVLDLVRNDSRFQEFLTHIIIRHKTRIITKYIIYFENLLVKGQFHVVYNSKKKEPTIVDFKISDKNPEPVIQPEIIEEDTETTLIQEIIIEVIKEVTEQNEAEAVENTIQEQNIENEHSPEHQQLISIFNQYNPSTTVVRIVNMWVRKPFTTFTEVSLLLEVGEGRFMYFFLLKNLEDNTYTFWGQEDVESPNHYTLPRRQSRVQEQDVIQVISFLNEQFPESVGAKFVKSRVRDFPENRRRELIVLRLQTQKVRYITLVDENGERRVQEWTILKDNLPSLTPNIENIITLQTDIQTQVIEITEDQPHDPTSDFSGTITLEPTTPTQEQIQHVQQQINSIDNLVEENPVIKQILETLIQKPEITEEIIETVEVIKYEGITEVDVHVVTDEGTKDIVVVHDDKTDENIIVGQHDNVPTTPTEPTPISVTNPLVEEIEKLIKEQQQVPEDAQVETATTETQHGVTKITQTLISPSEPTVTTVTVITDPETQTTVIEQIITEEPPEVLIQPIEQIEVIQSPETGKEVQIIQNISPEEEKLVTKLVHYIEESNIKPVEEISMLYPIDLMTVTFCDVQYITLIYLKQQNIIALYLQISLLDMNEIHYLGYKVFEKMPHFTDKDILSVAVEVLDESSAQELAIKTIEKEYPLQLSQQPYITAKQYADIVVLSVTYNKGVKTNRYIVNINTINHEGDIVQHCTIDNTPPTHTITETQPSGHEVVTTDDVESLIEEDPIIKDIIQLVDEGKEQPIDDNIIKVKETEYEGSIQYDITVEVEGKDPAEEVENIVAIHDTTTHDNFLIGDNVGKPDSETLNYKPIDEVETITQIISDVISDITDEVKDGKPELQVEEILVKEEDGVFKVEELLGDQKTDETILVTGVIDPATGEYIIEENKPIPDDLVNQIINKPAPPVIFQPAVEIYEKQPQLPPIPQEEVTIEVQPEQTHQLIQQLLTKPQPVPEIQPPTEEQIKEAITSADPTITVVEIVEEEDTTLPNKVESEIIVSTDKGEISVVVEKDEEKVEVVVVEKEPETTEEEIVDEIQREDTTAYQPLNPNTVMFSKAEQILQLEEQPTQVQKEVTSTPPSDPLVETILYMRGNYPIIQDSSIIKILEDINTKTVKQYTIYFFQKIKQRYQVYKTTVEHNSEMIEPKITVKSFVLLIDNDEYVNTNLESEGAPKQTHVAYGFEHVSLADVAHDQTIQQIQQQLQQRYGHIIKGASLIDIEILELLNGKVNYILYYPHVQFAIYYDKLLRRIMLLNAISSVSEDKYQTLTSDEQENNQLFMNTLRHVISLHPSELQEYSIVKVQEQEKQGYIYYRIEFNAQNVKYQSISKTHKQHMNDIEELSWNEVVEISLDHYRLDPYSVEDLKRFKRITNIDKSDVRMIDQHLRNQNILLQHAHILGVASKPLNLGFSYCFFYRMETSEIMRWEIYVESFNNKIQITSMAYSSFTDGFMDFSAEGVEVGKVVGVLEHKVDLTEGYVVKNFEGKSFMFGNLFRIMIEMEGSLWQALIYHDYSDESISLLQWRSLPSEESCVKEVGEECQKCGHGYYKTNENTCAEEVPHCSEYLQPSKCSRCRGHYQLVNYICTKECGGLCPSFDV